MRELVTLVIVSSVSAGIVVHVDASMWLYQAALLSRVLGHGAAWYVMHASCDGGDGWECNIDPVDEMRKAG